MTGSPDIDPTHIIPDDPDPLKVAEDAVENTRSRWAKYHYEVVAFRGNDAESDRLFDAYVIARSDLAALRAKLAAEADEALPYREGQA